MKNFFLIVGLLLTVLAKPQGARSLQDGEKERAFFIKTLTRIADPVLKALSKNKLKKAMPVEAKAGVTDRSKYTHLEAFGRLLAGMAPWLELEPDETKEGLLRRKYTALAQRCITNATDPSAADFMNLKTAHNPWLMPLFLRRLCCGRQRSFGTHCLKAQRKM